MVALIPDDAVVEDVVFRHALDASFLWCQRDRGTRAPNYRLSEIAELDGQLAAHLEGIGLGGRRGLDISMEILRWGPGDGFVLATVAVHLGIDVLEAAIERLVDDPEYTPGLAAALGWLPFAVAAPVIQRWQTSERVGLRRIALGGAVAHRYDPGPALAAGVTSEDAALRAIALCGAGELGREDLQLLAQRAWHDRDSSCRFHARRSALLLRVPDAAGALIEPALSRTAHAEPACRLAMRHLPADMAREWQRSLASRPETVRLAVIAAGASGDPVYVPWLLEIMDQPVHARIAMDALTAITGFDLEQHDLEGSAPDGFFDGPTDDPDDSDVALPDDSDLEWPNATAVRAWWKAHTHPFQPGTPYLMGQLRNRAGLRHVLVHGSQKLRAVAAFELAHIAREPAATFPTAAPAPRQSAILARAGLVRIARLPNLGQLEHHERARAVLHLHV